jgi:hypothetical protein
VDDIQTTVYENKDAIVEKGSLILGEIDSEM